MYIRICILYTCTYIFILTYMPTYIPTYINTLTTLLNRSVDVPVPLDSVPLFVIAGSIVPVLDPRVMTLNNATNNSVITWNKLKVGHMTYSRQSHDYFLYSIFDMSGYLLTKTSMQVVNHGILTCTSYLIIRKIF